MCIQNFGRHCQTDSERLLRENFERSCLATLKLSTCIPTLSYLDLIRQMGKDV